MEFTGDLTYLDTSNLRVSGLIYFKNKNLLVSDRNTFISELKNQNPEIEQIDISAKNISTAIVKIKNKEVCCVIKDLNTNKYLIGVDGKILKKLSNDTNYPHEINLTQEVNVEKTYSIDSLRKIVEIENVLLNKEMEISEIILDDLKIEMKLTSNQLVILDSETNIKDFVEKLNTMISYLKQKNLSFKKMDFRFGNVIVE